MPEVDTVSALLKAWLWVKQIAELCDRVRSQFEVSAQTWFPSRAVSMAAAIR
jgi:hypothetical protein